MCHFLVRLATNNDCFFDSNIHLGAKGKFCDRLCEAELDLGLTVLWDFVCYIFTFNWGELHTVLVGGQGDEKYNKKRLKHTHLKLVFLPPSFSLKPYAK